MRIAIGSDHAGVDMKKDVIALLCDLGHDVADYGTETPQSVDYPDFGEKVSLAVSAGEFDRGVLICGTGIGMSIVANKFPNIRASLCNELFSARMSRLPTTQTSSSWGGASSAGTWRRRSFGSG